MPIPRKNWVIRSFPHQVDRTQVCLDESKAFIGWPALRDLERLSKDELKEALGREYQPQGARSLQMQLNMVWRFVHEIQIGDMVFMPYKAVFYVAVVTGDYQRDLDPSREAGGYCHFRTVRWLTNTRGVLENRRVDAPEPLRGALRPQLTIYSLQKYASQVQAWLNASIPDAADTSATAQLPIDTATSNTTPVPAPTVITPALASQAQQIIANAMESNDSERQRWAVEMVLKYKA